MTLPEKFHLYGQTITVSSEPSLIQRDDAVGTAVYRTNSIAIQPSTGSWTRHTDMIEHAFFHELVHMILNKMGHKLYSDEVFVDQFSALLHQALSTFEGELHV